jgi:L-lysine 6-transaminase
MTGLPRTHQELRSRLAEHVLVDGQHLALDTVRSVTPYIVDAITGESYLDLSTFYASSPLGMNHPALTSDTEFGARLSRVAMNKPANPDFHTTEMLEFVETFARVLGDPRLPHLFFVEGGALAVENALKVAFDWKSRWNEQRGIDAGDLQAMHLRHAFHGRSGYTMSLTNTDPNKVARFPKFDWPRIDSPALSFPPAADQAEQEQVVLTQAEEFFASRPNQIACIVLEPIQGEGGDRHFSAVFLQQLQQLAHRNDALFVLDEVQTGAGLTGTAWCYQQLGLQPDVVAFAKKVQLGGVMAGGRVDEVPGNVFQTPSRISSTWGGALTDMVRSTKMLQVIEEHGLISNAAQRGEELVTGLTAIAEAGVITQVRGRGLMCAFDMPTRELRDDAVSRLERDEHVLVLKCGERSIRLRPPLSVTSETITAALLSISRVVSV